MTNKRVKLDIAEIEQPELDAKLVAESIAEQLERRISQKRAMKQAMLRAHARRRQGLHDPLWRPPVGRRNGPCGDGA